MYSQANVRAGKWLRPPPPALLSVIVDTEKVLQEADGPMKRAVPWPAMRDGWKGVRPGVRLKSRTVSAAEEPEEHQRQKPTQRVKFTKAIARHTKIRERNPSLGYICQGEPHQRSHNAPKFEDRSQEETEWQEQGAREAAWKLAKSVLKLKEQERATFFSPFGK